MKAVTVRQPWASLIAAGVKTIETRPRATGYRGRIAIHAAVARPTVVDFGRWSVPPVMDRLCEWAEMHGRPVVIRRVDLPLGAVVASAVLTDCVPIVAERDLRSHSEGRHPLIAIANPDLHGVLGTWLSYLPNAVSPGRYIDKERSEWLRQQLPLGDFSPGRWALLLDDIKPTTERCPWCWGYTIWPDVCEVCGRLGKCDPVPARGQQAVPWEWHPKSPG